MNNRKENMLQAESLWLQVRLCNRELYQTALVNDQEHLIIVSSKQRELISNYFEQVAHRSMKLLKCRIKYLQRINVVIQNKIKANQAATARALKRVENGREMQKAFCR